MLKIKLQPSEMEGVYGGIEYFSLIGLDKTKPYSVVGVRGPIGVLFNHENLSQIFKIINEDSLGVTIENVDPADIQHCYTWPEFLAFAAKKYNINS